MEIAKVQALKNMGAIQSALLWVLNQSDGSKSLLDISVESKINFRDIKKAADLLRDHSLLKKINKRILCN